MELSTNGPTRVGPFLLCRNGFHTCRGERRAIPREEVEAAKQVLAKFRPAKLSQLDERLTAGLLKHDVEKLARRYISRGALVIAAIEMGITVVPVYDDDWIYLSEDDHGWEPFIRTAYISINRRDLDRLLREVRK